MTFCCYIRGFHYWKLDFCCGWPSPASRRSSLWGRPGVPLKEADTLRDLISSEPSRDVQGLQSIKFFSLEIPGTLEIPCPVWLRCLLEGPTTTAPLFHLQDFPKSQTACHHHPYTTHNPYTTQGSCYSPYKPMGFGGVQKFDNATKASLPTFRK